MAATVELERVTKSYNGFLAVDALSFAIAPGQIFGLLGPNGAGKTTTIRMMIGIIVPDSGAIRIFGAAPTRATLRRVGYLPEERGLYRRMTVRENLVFLGELRGLHAADALARSRTWTERLGIGEWLDHRLEELSKGMQQKVQFIAALLHDPEFIVMDEPFAGLDPLNANHLKDVLVDLKIRGHTILFSTHRMDQVEKLCDAICLVDRGRAVLAGGLREIKARWGERFVQIEYHGGRSFLAENGLIESFNDYGNYAELRLRPGVDPQELLRRALAEARVLRFEVVEPSLEQIFIDQIGRRHD
jgi:ABC-2 type transport system ATP-binding protein